MLNGYFPRARVVAGRQWYAGGSRSHRRRGVSDIIATILLVAITVVLAAVLYILISGLTSHGVGPGPHSVQFTSTSHSGSGSTFWVYMAVTPTIGVTTTMFGLKVTLVGGSTLSTAAIPVACAFTSAPSPTTCTGVASAWYGLLMNATGSTPVAMYGAAGWVYPSGTSTIALNNGYSLIVVTATGVAGSGDVISAYSAGTTSVSGQGDL